MAVPANAEFSPFPTVATFKHGILWQYPVVLASKAGSVTSGRVVSGRLRETGGQYDDESPGSPLLFMRAAGRAVTMQRTVTAIFVEQHLDWYAWLYDTLVTAGHPG